MMDAQIQSPSRTLDPSRIEVVDDAMAEVLRRMTPTQRLAIGTSIWRSARRMLHSILSDAHPGWSCQEVEREVSRRMNIGSR